MDRLVPILHPSHVIVRFCQLSPAEKDALALSNPSESLSLILYYWTMKEAISKALGEGLSFPFDELDVSPLRAEEGTSSLDVRASKCTIKKIELGEGEEGRYIIAIAVLGSQSHDIQDVEVEMVNVERLVEEVLIAADAK